MIDLDEMERLYQWMSARGVVHARSGDMELSLAEHVAPVAVGARPEELVAERDVLLAALNPEKPGVLDPYLDPDLYPAGQVPSELLEDSDGT